MLDHDKDERDLEKRCRNCEEIDGNQLIRVILQECPPCLRWPGLPVRLQLQRLAVVLTGSLDFQCLRA